MDYGPLNVGHKEGLHLSEIHFNKYEVKGAYHWVECFGPITKLNAYTIERYAMVSKALAAHVDRGEPLLDVGCGDAALTGIMANDLGAVVDGVDTTPLSIELAKQEFGKRGYAGNFQVIDGYDYPFADAKFAAVVCSDVIEHVQQPERMLREMWRVLRPGGRLVVTTPIRYTERPLDPMHVQEWFPQQFADFCSGVLGVPVEVQQSHPAALAELYASGRPVLGRATRLLINVMTRLGRNPFAEDRGYRAFSTQAMIAIKPL